MVKNASLDGRKFQRQHSIGNFIADFYCASERLVIELDGEGHYTGATSLTDRQRRLYIESQGIRVLRFENKLVFESGAWVLNVIRSHFDWWRHDGEPALAYDDRSLLIEPPCPSGTIIRKRAS